MDAKSFSKFVVMFSLFLTSGCCPCLHSSGLNSSDIEGHNSCTVASISDATIYGIWQQPVTLENGKWQGRAFVPDGASRPVMVLDRNIHVLGDMDGDGRQECAVILYENQGGSGTFCHLVILKDEDGRCESIATLPLGDRIKVEGGVIDNGVLELDILEHAPADPMCCPSRHIRKRWRLDAGRLSPL